MKLLLLLVPFFTFSQAQIAKGVALDKDTNNPIPYVNISILESQIGTSSNEDGSYSLAIDEKDFDKKVHVSSLGFRDTILTVPSFIKLKTVYLSPLVEALDQVLISEKFEDKFLEVNPIKKKEIFGGFGSLYKHPYVFALYLPFDSTYADVNYITKARVHINKVNLLGGSKSMPSKFRFRIFSVGKDSLPDKDLVSKSLVVTTTKKQRIAEINLSDYGLIFPKEGLYVAIEWLHIPFNAYEFTYAKGKVIKRKITETRYAPRLS